MSWVLESAMILVLISQWQESGICIQYAYSLIQNISFGSEIQNIFLNVFMFRLLSVSPSCGSQILKFKKHRNYTQNFNKTDF